MLVLDEADDMLSKGFKEQIYKVFRTLNDDLQVGEIYISCSLVNISIIISLLVTAWSYLGEI